MCRDATRYCEARVPFAPTVHVRARRPLRSSPARRSGWRWGARCCAAEIECHNRTDAVVVEAPRVERNDAAKAQVHLIAALSTRTRSSARKRGAATEEWCRAFSKRSWTPSARTGSCGSRSGEAASGDLGGLSGCAERGQGDARPARENQWKVGIPASPKTVRGTRLDAKIVLRGAVA